MTPTFSVIAPDAAWRQHLIDDDAGIRALLERTHRIAVLGIKTAESRQPAYYVPEYAKRAGYEIVPVPVYYPEVTEILGEPVYRTVSAVPGEVDMVNVFRRARDIDAHVEDIIAKRPASVWFQLGIRNDPAAERFARAGIDVDFRDGTDDLHVPGGELPGRLKAPLISVIVSALNEEKTLKPSVDSVMAAARSAGRRASCSAGRSPSARTPGSPPPGRC